MVLIKYSGNVWLQMLFYSESKQLSEQTAVETNVIKVYYVDSRQLNDTQKTAFFSFILKCFRLE